MILAVPVIDPATAELEKSTPVDRVLAHGGCHPTSSKRLQISAAPSMSVEKWTDALIGQSSPLIVRTYTPLGRSYPVKLKLRTAFPNQPCMDLTVYGSKMAF